MYVHVGHIIYVNLCFIILSYIDICNSNIQLRLKTLGLLTWSKEGLKKNLTVKHESRLNSGKLSANGLFSWLALFSRTLAKFFSRKGSTSKLVIWKPATVDSHNKYIYYEQFLTETSLFSIVNAGIMTLFAIPNLINVLTFKIRSKKGVRTKFMLIFLFGFLAFVLSLLRFMKE